MRILVNGIRLYVDIEGPGLVPDGERMREKPVLILLHGGPGADHSIYKPAFSRLADLCQIVYYDHRASGRSEDGPRESWTLAQWADDLKALCDELGIERPIVLGTSFGGFVAQAYAVRYPAHPAGLVLVSTAARMDFEAVYAAFARIGGVPAGAAARAYWSGPTAETRARYFEQCLPLYRARGGGSPDWLKRTIVRNEVAIHFNGPSNEQGRMDFRASLGGVQCPVLVMAGERDPITPVAFGETIAACLPPSLTSFRRFADCGHGIVADDPEGFFAALETFIAELGPATAGAA